MTEFTALCNKGNSFSTTRPLALAATIVLPKLLLKAKTIDIIIAYVCINEAIAVGFNTRTNLGGRFLIDIAKKVELQLYENAEIIFATDSCDQYGNSSPSSLAYKTGQYAGLMSGTISRRLSGVKKPEDFYRIGWGSFINERVKKVSPHDPDLDSETLDFWGAGERHWRLAAKEQQPQHCHRALDRLEAARSDGILTRAVVESMQTLLLTQTLRVEIME
ncbi:uncharacterized protein PAC_20079 [Phialocephala subalpina]|uniref:Uncharacterized protein n=1 Tax=Phialocephala subalpina TaxID=576137 RepID=A0A1L7XYT2_9HELO|nr:uncharacterized protein PAC_20079 [Phialocephala subalpina]